MWTLIFVGLISADMLVAACRFPPSLWCSSPAIARECKVEFQCQNHINTVSDSRVEFAVYYESLCPDCQNLMRNQLGPAYDAVGSIMDLQLVPYGNAREEKNGTRWNFHCQHGPDECTGNLIEVCAMYILKKVSAYFPFILCMETATTVKPEESAIKCAKQYGIDLQPILQCANTDQGNRLEHKMAQLTDKLRPPHKFVPWVTLFKVHTEKIQEAAESNLIKLICDSYKGFKKPEACNTVHIGGCSR